MTEQYFEDNVVLNLNSSKFICGKKFASHFYRETRQSKV